ncbi:MAG: RNA-binding S4 domain-containing protein [Actinomycetes bacterium]
MDETRVDRWLWAIRLYKTRTAASDACQGGHVSVNGISAKPATRVHVGDRVEARLDHRDRLLEVVRVIDKRVGAPIAATCVIDHSAPIPSDPTPPPLTRERGAGRPTKRERRQIDRHRGR